LILPSLIPDHKDDIALLNQTIERIPYNLCIDDSVLYLPSIIFDRAEAARCVMNHLIGLGHKRIAFVAVNDQRLMGHSQALLEHNLAYDDNLVDFLDHAYSAAQSSYDMITRLIETRVDFTAVFAATDEAAIGAIAAVKDHGLSVPQDIAVVSIDNIEMASMVRPALTTVDVPNRMLARFAIQSLQTQKDFPD
jgi:LacI family repressor for deo operon, udp, cdd, tsx, nupC, and nupG